jgi:hypothetical protein
MGVLVELQLPGTDTLPLVRLLSESLYENKSNFSQEVCSVCAGWLVGWAFGMCVQAA